MKNRKRNIARKSRNAASNRAGNVSARPDPSPLRQQGSGPAQSGFDPQNPNTPHSDLPNSSPEAGGREPEAPSGFVSQNPAAAPFTARNRQNAAHSTGPRTPEGKAASALNAFKHGLSIQRHAVLHDEEPAQYAQLLSELREIYEPRSRREDLAVEDITQCRWALQRFDEAEAICLQKLTDSFNDPVAFEGEEPIGAGESLAHAATVLTEYDDKDRRYVEPNAHYPTFDKIHRYRTHWERKHARALAEFDRAQRARHAEANQTRAEAKEARAEAQAERQAEAHALKQELALARERRRQELHDLRSATVKAQRPTETTESQDPAEDATMAYFESLLNAPTPITEQDFLGIRTGQFENGFVSQNSDALPQPPQNQVA